MVWYVAIIIPEAVKYRWILTVKPGMGWGHVVHGSSPLSRCLPTGSGHTGVSHQRTSATSYHRNTASPVKWWGQLWYVIIPPTGRGYWWRSENGSSAVVLLAVPVTMYTAGSARWSAIHKVCSQARRVCVCEGLWGVVGALLPSLAVYRSVVCVGHCGDPVCRPTRLIVS